MKFSLVLFWLFITRSFAKSPSNNYAPGKVKCLSSNSSLLREGNSISNKEKEWIKSRHKKTNGALVDFLNDADLKDFDAEKFINNNEAHSINLGLAFPGGGYRAMLASAGQLAALDNRTEDGVEKALGGILQSATYVSALSGGSWLIGSLAMQDWPSVQEIVFENLDDLWNLTYTRQLANQTSLTSIGFSILFDDLDSALSHVNYWGNDSDGIKYDIQAKEEANYDTSLTDIWARALAHQLFPKGNDNYGSSATWSDLQTKDVFANHDMPFPILIALGRKPGSFVYNLNSTVIEFNPFEMGSFDPSLNSFTDLKYIGTNVSDGKPIDGFCVQGFDNAGFIMGTSSSLFNQFLNTLVCDKCYSLNFLVKPIVKHFLGHLSKTYEDIALYKPNPFYNSRYAKSENITKNDTLYLIDGGLAGEIIPLSSLMTKERALDVVFAFDNSNDDEVKWPNGSALIFTYERQFSEQGRSTICPYVPDEVSFLAQNLTAKPTFFGCDASNLTDLVKEGVTPPILIYIANRPYEFYSNVSTYKLTYTDEEKKAMIQNGFDTVSRLNNSIDSEWAACVGCAIIRREQERQNIEQSDQCKRCFQRYCWDGKITTSDNTYFAPVNFTDSGLTNDSTVFFNSSNNSGHSNFIRRLVTRSSSIGNTLSLPLTSYIALYVVIISLIVI